MSGHSKWANIKHKKGKKDAQRGKIFTRLAKEITIAAREGGGDPDGNPRLRLAVLNARAENMPNENIQRAIKRGTGEIAGATIEEYTYEGYGPHGVSVIIEVATDNKNRAIAEVRSLFTKYGGNLGEQNSVLWNFVRSGVILVSTNGKSEDEMLEAILEAGASDMEYDEEQTRIICSIENYGAVNKYLQEHKFNILESKLEYIPNTYIRVSDVEQAKRIMRFIDALEDFEDAQNVYTNFEIDESIEDLID
ncbi:MAG TPA: YebC/PmpR family DNA-binding transcriptional regulator [Candidatus Kapabacteria bacterium]|jgi:YebC/PmpR family DNA-binding regulatory protein|nr:YebC/PmpR family DNA-binding transcriptional regulator [Candidatus Kapabacteria bacterium]HOV91494.1 YebC/PmpR family DNA-binding transcriptional regulator [Candidatus Kapabacteria bacterium]